jgi:hypothetical protein
VTNTLCKCDGFELLILWCARRWGAHFDTGQAYKLIYNTTQHSNATHRLLGGPARTRALTSSSSIRLNNWCKSNISLTPGSNRLTAHHCHSQPSGLHCTFTRIPNHISKQVCGVFVYMPMNTDDAPTDTRMSNSS